MWFRLQISPTMKIEQRLVLTEMLIISKSLHLDITKLSSFHRLIKFRNRLDTNCCLFDVEYYMDDEDSIELIN